MKRRLAYWATLAHRITGIGLFVYLFLHIWALRSLFDRPSFEREMELFSSPPGLVLEWLLGACVFYHAFNGLRVIAVELFGQEGRQRQLFWGVLAVMASALVVMAFFIAWGHHPQEDARFVVFGVGMAWLSVAPLYLAWQMVRQGLLRRHIVWRFQRLTGLMLVILVVGHYAFMHLTFYTGHDYETVLGRMGNPVVRAIDFLLLVVCFWHGTYGAVTVLKDYFAPSAGRTAVEWALYAAVLLFAGLGTHTLLFLPAP